MHLGIFVVAVVRANARLDRGETTPEDASIYDRVEVIRIEAVPIY